MTTAVPAYVKAHTTGRWAEIIFRALSSRVATRWQFISFLGAGGGEWRRVVDVLAVRKNTSQPEHPALSVATYSTLCSSKSKADQRAPTRSDCGRLREVAKIHRAKAVVLFSWKRGDNSSFSQLNLRTLQWQPVENAAVFAQ